MSDHADDDTLLSLRGDHDLLIDMRRIMLDLREDMRVHAKTVAGLDLRLVSLERHASDTPGRFVTTEGPLIQKLNDLAYEWIWFKGVGKFLYSGILIMVSAAVSLALSQVIRVVPGLHIP